VIFSSCHDPLLLMGYVMAQRHGLEAFIPFFFSLQKRLAVPAAVAISRKSVASLSTV
jgi:hypothetical protein